jgi:hypothetical protein
MQSAELEQIEEKSPVYIVQVVMSSPNHILESKEIDDITQETVYKFKKDTRNKINAIRMRQKAPIFNNALDFYGLHLCRDDQIQKIQQAITEANTELEAIDRSLGASVVFIPLNIHEVRRGELYGQVIAAIRFRILSEVIERIEDKVGQLPKQSLEAMKNLIERMRAVNVLNDPEVDKKLNEIRDKILSQDVETLRKDLEQELTMTKQRMTYVSL